MEDTPDELVAFAGHLADLSGAVLRRHFRRPVATESKADGSPVSAADREAERALRAAIEEAWPDHGIVGEEFGTVRAGAETRWVLDPIDGTQSYLSGKPVFTTLIALLSGGEPVLGIVDQPVTGERWVAVRGRATILNGAPVRTRGCAALSEAVLYTTGPDLFPCGKAASFARLKAAAGTTLYSADAYAFALLASGTVDLAVESGLKPHDFCALIPLIEGAGGVLTDWHGRSLDLERPADVLAAGDAGLHARALAALQGSDTSA